MKKAILLALLLAPSVLTAAQPLKALLIAGGCCHDYAKQQEILSKGIQARANVQVDVVWTDDKSVNPPLPLYDNPDWAKGYDIIIHDECAAGEKSKEVLQRVLDAHKTIPAVHLHCAMHSFRTGEDKWFKHLGLQSNSHGPQEPIAITFVDKEHPITKPLTEWATIKEELYNNVNVFDAHPLAMGKQMVKQKDGTTKEVTSIVAWTNEKQGARSFSTTIGHNNDTVADARYLDLLTRGLLWAMDKLNPDYLTPFQGQNQVTFVPAKPVEAPKPAPAPKDATGIKATASSEESGKNNFAWCAVDGDEGTRWCAVNGAYPQWLQLELDKPQTLTGIETIWENKGVYQFKIEGSADGKVWTTLADGSANTKNAPYSNDFAKVDGIRFVKVHALGKTSGGFASIREVKLKGPGIKGVAPKLSAEQKKEYDKANDPFKDSGNVEPKIVKLTPEQEAAILKDVKVADGFEATLFANSAAANYPVFVAAAPDGTLYVSSDGNGSLGRNPKRGRIIRVRDLDGDGRADETKVFCEVDSPRGLVWDHDRLYLVHPPHLSEFIDADHDGVAEKQNILVKDIAFGFKDRPADHTTNGLSLGIDGWLYIAGGDFGFMKATGTDGKTLQHRGGGVIRVRPDGTGLEIYSTGTRNILEVAISPLMDIFARDNTNDGGGWNVRFHHFTGLDDHGYPRLYKNFNDECIQPLADYGGGSGCGAVYIDEPGFGAWNNAPFTADWGSGALWHHQVKPKGATFEETRKPEPFIKMTRPTDADVDGMSRVYCASWKGATFDWAGPDVGYIVQVKPKGWTLGRAGVSPAAVGILPGAPTGNASGETPKTAGKMPALPIEPLPDFAKAKDAELVKMLESASNRRRMEAQRELLRRDSTSRMTEFEHSLARPQREAQSQSLASRKQIAAATDGALVALAANKLAGLPTRVAAVYAMTMRLAKFHDWQGMEGIGKLAADPLLAAFVLRAGGDALFIWDPSETFGGRQPYFDQLSSSDPLAKLEAIVAVTSQLVNYKAWKGGAMAGMTIEEERRALISDFSTAITKLLSDADPVVVHTAFRALATLQAHEATFAVVDNSTAALTQRNGALLALMHIHTPEVVTGLIKRLGKATDPALRQGILAALCRLHFKEGEWKGDSWGTRPDTRGPYYQPEAWSETPKIAVALKDALAKASPEEAAFLVKEMNRNRIQSNDALERILALAKQDPKVIPDAVAQLAVAEEVPAEAVPILIGVLAGRAGVPPAGGGILPTPSPSQTASGGTPDAAGKMPALPSTLAGAIIALAKTDSAEGVSATLAALQPLQKMPESQKDFEVATTAFFAAPKLENHHLLIEQIAEKLDGPTSRFADAALLYLAARTSGSPESKELSAKALDHGWQDTTRRVQIIEAIAAVKHQASAARVLAALEDADPKIKAAAERAAKAMKIQKIEDKTPKIATLKPEEAFAAVLKEKGDISLGEQIFTRATCVACHTTSESQPQKGPYLGNIAQTYKRPDLAQNILDPNKTIAQGFASELVTLKDGTINMGFITLEGASEIKLRNIAAQEFTYKTSDIAKRDKLPTSMMPPMLMANFTVKEFASLLDYLESLVKK